MGVFFQGIVDIWTIFSLWQKPALGTDVSHVTDTTDEVNTW